MTQERRYVLEAEKRTGLGKGVARKLRANGMVPAVLYGDDKPSETLSVNTKTFEKLLHDIAGETVIVTLNRKDESGEEPIFLKDVQRDPVSDKIVHIDLLRVSMTRELRLEIPIQSVGTPVGVKKGGILESLVRAVEIKCLPGDIPQHFEVDISELEINHSVHISDLNIDPKIEVLTPLDTTIFTIVPPKIEEEPVAEEEEELEGVEGEEEAEPEVIGKGKAKEEEEATEEEEKGERK